MASSKKKEEPTAKTSTALVAASPPPAKPVVIKQYKPDPLPPQNNTATTPVFSQAILKPTGLKDGPAATEGQEGAPEQALTNARVKSTTLSEDGGTTTEEVNPETGEIVTTTRTKTVTTTKRVVKTDPEYDVTEYKVGCFCTVL